MARMSQELIKRRKRMLEAHEMGVTPHVFLNQMAEEATKDIKDPVQAEKVTKREYKKLETDWYSRRLGANGWLRKLEDAEEIEDIHTRQLFQIRTIQSEAYRMIKMRQEVSPMMRLMAMSRLQAAIQDERKYLGIPNLVQPEILTEDELKEIEVRMEGDKFYELLYAADPELADQMIKKIIRVGGIPNDQLDSHT